MTSDPTRDVHLPPLPPLLAECQRLRAVYEAALAVCHSANDECRDDGQVFVAGDSLQVLNDALNVVEEADDDEEDESIEAVK